MISRQDPTMSVTVSSGQTHDVSSGQTDTGDIVLSVGVLNVLDGGTATTTTIDWGGVEFVNAGGIDNGTFISGGTQYDYGLVTG